MCVCVIWPEAETFLAFSRMAMLSWITAAGFKHFTLRLLHSVPWGLGLLYAQGELKQPRRQREYWTAGSIVDGADKRPGYQISGDSRKRAKLGMTSGKLLTSICTTWYRFAKTPLPVAVRRSKTPWLNLPISFVPITDFDHGCLLYGVRLNSLPGWQVNTRAAKR